MSVPSFAFGMAAAESQFVPDTMAEQDRFVAAWTDALLSEDEDAVFGLPHSDVYQAWNPEFRNEAVERVIDAVEAVKVGEGLEPADVETRLLVRHYLTLFAFDRAAIEALAEAPGPSDLDQDLDGITIGEDFATTSAEVNTAIAEGIARLGPVEDALQARLATRPVATVNELWEAGALGKVQDPLPELGVDAALRPYTDTLATLIPLGGTYTLRVRTAEHETVMTDIPFGTMLPIDIDDDARTGLGGLDILVGVVLDSAPGVTVGVDMAPDFTGQLSGVAPALVVSRVANAELPDFEPHEIALVEAFVSMNAGRSIAFVGVDAASTPLPDQVTIAFFTGAEAGITTVTDMGDITQDDVAALNGGGRALANAVATEAGVAIPWSDIDGAPDQVEAAVADATILMEQQLAAAEAEMDAARAAVDSVLAPHLAEVDARRAAAEATADATSAPYRSYAESLTAYAGTVATDTAAAGSGAVDAALMRAEAETQAALEAVADTVTPFQAAAETMAAPYQAYADETQDYWDGQLNDVITVATDATAGPLADATAALTAAQNDASDEADAASALAEAQIASTSAYLEDNALTPAADFVAASRAAAFVTAVNANKAAGGTRNSYRDYVAEQTGDAEGYLGDLVPATFRVRHDKVLPEGTTPPEADPVVDAVGQAAGATDPLTGAAADFANVAGGEADEATDALAESIDAGALSDFKLQVRTVSPRGPLALTAGIVNNDADGNYRDATTTLLNIDAPPEAFNATVIRSDGFTVRLEATTPATLSGAVVRDSVNGRADVTAFVIGPIPKSISMSLLDTTYDYDATDRVAIISIQRLRFTDHAAFENWLAGGGFSGKFLAFTLLDLPREFSAAVDGGDASYRASERISAIEYVKAKFTNDALRGDLVRFTMLGIPTAFDFAVDEAGDSAAYTADGPINVIDIVRTSGLTLSTLPAPGFIVALRSGSDELVHVRVLNVVGLAGGSGPGGSFFQANLQGGYPFYVGATRDDMTVAGLLTAMPDLIAVTLRPSDGLALDLTLSPAISAGMAAVATGPSIGGKVASLAISNLPRDVHLDIDARVPSVRYTASGMIGAIVLALRMPNGQLGAGVGIYDLPTSFYFGLQQFGNGLPNVVYTASQSTLDIYVEVQGDQLGVFPGHAILWIQNLPRSGFSVGASGNNYYVRAVHDRLTQFYMDVGYRFNGAFNYARNFVDSWWLLAGAYAYLTYNVNVKHFIVNMANLRSLDVTPKIPMLQVSVDGVFQAVFDIDLFANLRAGLYLYLLRWIRIVDITINWSHAGAFPLYFTTWTYRWSYWTFTLIILPIICGISWSGVDWGTLRFEVVLGLRLPSSFYTTVNGFGVAYGTSSWFINPGGIIPGWIIYAYALVTGFSASLSTRWRTYC